MSTAQETSSGNMGRFLLSQVQIIPTTNTLYLLRCHGMGHKWGEPHFPYFFYYTVMLTYLIIYITALTGNYPRDRGLLCYTLSLTPTQCFSIQLSSYRCTLLNEWMMNEHEAKQNKSSSWIREFHHQRKDSDLDPKTWVIKSTDLLAGLRGI